MALIDDVKVALRVTTDAMDSEVQMLVDAALADMRRVHVREELLDEDDMAPLVKSAVCLYAKARFGYDNDEAEMFDESYRQLVADFLNSPTSYMRSPDEEGEDGTDSAGDASDEDVSGESGETEDEA